MGLGIYLLVGAGIVFALLFALNNLLKTIFRRPKIGFLDLLLTFMTTLVLLASLIAAQTETQPDGHIAQVALYVGGGLAAFSLIVTLLELIRPPRLKGSRGILGIYSGFLLVVASFGVPFAAAYFSVQTQAAAAPTQIAQASGQATAVALSTEDIEMTRQARSSAIYQSISQIVTDEIHIDIDTVTSALQAGTPLATIIDAHGGSVEHVISAITLLMQDNVRQALAVGDINPIQGALAISQMENFIRIAVNSDFNQLGGRLGLATEDPNSTPVPLFSLLTTTLSPAAQTTSQSSSVTPPSATSLTVQSPSLTATVSATRTLRPTRTPMPTLFHYSTRTPAPTPTLVTPCVASVQYNLRLRAAPNRDAETLLTIPFGTTITLFGKGSASDNDAFWWYATYQDQAGWVDGQYLVISAACDRLPFKDSP